MAEFSAQDKLNMAQFLGTATVGLAQIQAALPLVKDDGLRKLIEAGITAREGQIKGVQEFLHAHEVI